MRARVLAAAIGCGVFALAGCTSTTRSAPPPGHGPTAPTTLPDPVTSPLPVGTEMLFSESGHGNHTLTLSGINRDKVKNVSVKWVCAGKGESLKVTDGTKTLVSSGCSSNATRSSIFGGDVPLSITRSLTWTVEADPSTSWRMAVYTG
jgi:hypothetical protein